VAATARLPLRLSRYATPRQRVLGIRQVAYTRDGDKNVFALRHESDRASLIAAQCFLGRLRRNWKRLAVLNGIAYEKILVYLERTRIFDSSVDRGHPSLAAAPTVRYSSLAFSRAASMIPFLSCKPFAEKVNLACCVLHEGWWDRPALSTEKILGFTHNDGSFDDVLSSRPVSRPRI